MRWLQVLQGLASLLFVGHLRSRSQPGLLAVWRSVLRVVGVLSVLSVMELLELVELLQLMLLELMECKLAVVGRSLTTLAAG